MLAGLLGGLLAMSFTYPAVAQSQSAALRDELREFRRDYPEAQYRSSVGYGSTRDEAYKNALHEWMTEIIMTVETVRRSEYAAEETDERLRQHYRVSRETRIRSSLRNVYGLRKEFSEFRDDVICIVYVKRASMSAQVRREIRSLADSLDEALHTFDICKQRNNLGGMIVAQVGANRLADRLDEKRGIYQVVAQPQQAIDGSEERNMRLRDARELLNGRIAALEIELATHSISASVGGRCAGDVGGRLVTGAGHGVCGVPLLLRIQSGLDDSNLFGRYEAVVTGEDGSFRLSANNFILTREVGELSVEIDLESLCELENGKSISQSELPSPNLLGRVAARVVVSDAVANSAQNGTAGEVYVPGGMATFSGESVYVHGFSIQTRPVTGGEVRRILRETPALRSLHPAGSYPEDTQRPATGLTFRVMGEVARAFGGRLPTGHEWALASNRWEAKFETEEWEAVSSSDPHGEHYYIVRLVRKDGSYSVQSHRRSYGASTKNVTFRIVR